MERIDSVLGNVHADIDLASARAAHDAAGTLERVVLDETERRRSRLRVTTDAGTDLGIVVDRPALSGGDVLEHTPDRMIVVTLEPRDAVAVTLPDPTAEGLALAAELGHRIGNQHWDLAVSGGAVYVPLVADRHILERIVRSVLPDCEIHAVTVDAELFAADPGAHGHTRGGAAAHQSHGDEGAPHHHGHDGTDHHHNHDGDDHEHDSRGADHHHSHDGDDHEHDGSSEHEDHAH
ncbi:urease accessory protein UreE [Natronobiforma cellulositropha]|uniref:urease accessory protein UreE n=1 Tax=Natronobiforma cellulositropha TaxID=1679076 RepID=UPI0021D5E9DE|nr:urease accessory protein UreE [Natronobiforma cellulositropha]